MSNAQYSAKLLLVSRPMDSLSDKGCRSTWLSPKCSTAFFELKTKETFDPLDWLASLTTHIPNRGEQMVRYYGYCSNKSRGMGKKQGKDDAVPRLIESDPSPRVSQKMGQLDPENLMLKHEVETLGFLLSIHPLDRCYDILKGLDCVKARDLHAHVGKRVTTIDWQVTGKTVHTKDGDPMKFISFEDTTGIYETALFLKVYHQFCHMLNASRPYILKGKVEEDFGAITLMVNRIEFLDRYKRQAFHRGKPNRELMQTTGFF